MTNQKIVPLPLNIVVQVRRLVSNLIAQDRANGQHEDVEHGKEILLAIDTAISEAA